MALLGSSDSKMAEPGQPGPFGPYRLQELIASGGMAEIWLATDAKNQPFALRRMLDTSLFNFTARKRFVRGCEILAQISGHPNIIAYVEHGKISGTLYLLMEYIEASNLKLLLARNDPVLVENVGNIILDMAAGLEHIHDAGYMHLDFKPENVLVTRNGSLRLVDFDLTQPRPDKPVKSSDNPGTPAYMAPEQLLRQPFDHRADIYAFGVSVYELLTGKKPFAGESPDEILRKSMDRSNDFIPPRDINPDIPPALERTILKCIERDMDKRYPYMSVLVRDLQQALYV